MHSNEIGLHCQTTSSLKACCTILIFANWSFNLMKFKSVGVPNLFGMNVSWLF
jgi:hypothetical protein